MRRLLIAAALVVAAGAATAAAPTGLQRNVVFDTYPADARNGELLRRFKSPLTAARVAASLAGNRALLNAHPLNPALQRFALYVPPAPPPRTGYALLVFVPPWNDARIPGAWIPALDRTHTILVTAAHSGNDADVFNRREPLALLAAAGVTQRYHVDPARVYVGGFSGGSRVALRIALGYPDVFHGVLLDAGSDSIGTATIPLPPAGLLHRFQQSTRIVFLTGDDDMIRQAQLARASQSLHHWCAFDVDSITLLHTGHTLADAAGFSRGMDALLAPAAPDAAALAQCRKRHQRALAKALGNVRSLVSAGQRDQAKRALESVDDRFGGLAAPRSIVLMQRLNASIRAGPNTHSTR